MHNEKQDWGKAYQQIADLITEKVPEIKHVDLYHGQEQLIDDDGNWIPFQCPAVFLEFTFTPEDIGERRQLLNTDVTVRLAYETLSDSNMGSMGQDRALKFIALMRKINEALHGAEGDDFGPMSRTGQTKHEAPPYMIMWSQTYATVILDYSATQRYEELEDVPLEIDQGGGPAPAPSDLVVVRNSDGTYNVELDPGQVHVLPNVTHTNSDGLPVTLPAMTPFAADRCEVLQPGTVQLYDSANQPLGPSISVGAGSTIPLTAPDGTVAGRNSLGTAITPLTPVRSGQSINLPIADSVITRPDGTTVNLPATLPSDVRNMRSGINYAISEAVWSGQTQAYTVGDEATFWALLNYRSVIHPYPAQVATPGNTWTTLLSLNKWGDHRRFTDRLGTEVYADGIIHDHLYDMWYYRPATMFTGSFNAAIPAAQALVVNGFDNWFLTPFPLLRSLANNGGGTLLNYAPFNITSVALVSSTTVPLQPGNCYHLTVVGAYQNFTKSTSQTYLVCRRAV